MSKKLNTASISNELAESAFFRPNTQPGKQEEILPTPLSETLITKEEQAKQTILERSNARTTVRPNGKRIITRNAFEIYEDQMDSLRKLSLQEKMQGRLGSMSAMVREAIDSYLQKKSLY